MILETKRLILQEMTQEDFPSLCKILQNDDVMYAYEGAFNDAEVQSWLDKQLENYKEYGFGLWAVVLKEKRNGMTCLDKFVKHYRGVDMPHFLFSVKRIL